MTAFAILFHPSYSNAIFQQNQNCLEKIGKHDVLLTGDIEAEREGWLVSTHPDSLKADVLVAPHHGSLTSSTVNFVDQVSPMVVIFTVGNNNRWNFPKPEIIARYEAIGSQIYQTNSHGAVVFTSNSKGFRIVSQRKRYPRLWH